MSFVTKHIVVTLLVITDNAVRHRHTGTHTHPKKHGRSRVNFAVAVGNGFPPNKLRFKVHMTCATFSFCSLTKPERGENSAHHMTKRDVVPRYGDILSGHYGESTTAGFQQST